MAQFMDLKKDAKMVAAKFFEYKLGYKLIGNPYVKNAMDEIRSFCENSNMTYYFDKKGNFICAQAV